MPADSSETRAAILDAAEAQFADKGFAAASMSEIAVAAKVAKSLLHHHFGSKEGLWHAVKERRFADFWSRQSRLFESLPANAELIERSVEAYFQFLRDNPSFVRLMGWHFLESEALPGGGDEVGPPQVAAAVEKLREGQAAGFIRDDVDPAHILLAFFALVVHWHQGKAVYLGWLRRKSKGSDQAYLDDVLRLFTRALAPAP